MKGLEYYIDRWRQFTVPEVGNLRSFRHVIDVDISVMPNIIEEV